MAGVIIISSLIIFLGLRIEYKEKHRRRKFYRTFFEYHYNRGGIFSKQVTKETEEEAIYFFTLNEPSHVKGRRNYTVTLKLNNNLTNVIVSVETSFNGSQKRSINSFPNISQIHDKVKNLAFQPEKI